MLELKNLKKDYRTGDSITHALADVSISFRPQEFVAILGPSGSGKTTLLNIIGGLDRYDSGDLVLNGKSTKNFKETDWDSYRNNSVGFVFQNYDLIPHLSVLANVELGMTLSGVDKKERQSLAKQALIEVGLKKQLNKRPGQLSGGQMQRVAIARAIAGNPDILLCDEPTGALDSETSEQIMQLIKKIANGRLVIMVTHNPELAKRYASRIVHFKDGQIRSDSAPFQEKDNTAAFSLKRTKMSYWNALKLSFTNIMTKKGRTFLTALASSIGIISIAIVLAISNGFQKQIDTTMSKALAKYPISISQTAQDMNAAKDRKTNSRMSKSRGYVTAQEDANQAAQHVNKISKKYVDYIKKINPKYANSVAFQRCANLNLLSRVHGKVERVQFSSTSPSENSDSLAAMRSKAMNSIGIGSSVFPTSLKKNHSSFLQRNYRLLAGAWPKKSTDLVLVIDNHNAININSLKNLSFKLKKNSKVKFKQLVGKEFRIVNNNNYYQKLPTGIFIPAKADPAMYNGAKTRLKLTAVIKPKSTDSQALLATGIAYSDALTQKVIRDNKNSAIVSAQRRSSKNVLTGQSLNQTQKKAMLQNLGASSVPTSIMIYPNTFTNKDKVLDYLDKWNKGKKKSDKIIYTDMSSAVTSMTGGLLSSITTILVAFAAISLITSMIMIGILTYTSVLERTKEIGILKALGARKKDITRVFDAETFILGIFSGILGIFIAYLATLPINSIIYKITELKIVAQLNPVHALLLIIIATILTLLGGHIPARMAAKKDAAKALRSE